MEWFSQKTSIAGIQISNWILVLVAIIVIWIIYSFISHFVRQNCMPGRYIESFRPVGRKNSLFAQPKRFAHNGLVGGSSPSSS